MLPLYVLSETYSGFCIRFYGENDCKKISVHILDSHRQKK